MFFYFHLKGRAVHSEPEVLDLPDLGAARHKAASLCTVLINESATGQGETNWEMCVTDETGTACFSFAFANVGKAACRIRAYRERAEQAFPASPPAAR